MRVNGDSRTDLQEPVKKSFCQSLRRDTHWKCLILTMLISGCLAAIVWCRLTTVRSDAMAGLSGTPCEDGYVYIPVAFVLMLYLVYLVECWHCHTRIQLQCKLDVSTAYDHVRSLQEALPIVWWKALCYHYVRRTRQVTRYRNGDAFTTTQVYYERVNSHTASSAFNFTRCGIKDVSKQLINLEKYPATKIRISKGFSFAVLDAEQEYEEQRSQFFQEHERLDDYMETREGLDLMNANFKEYMIAFADAAHLPWYVSQAVFWLASFLLLSWPLRVLIEYKTAYVHYHVHKLFGTSILDAAGGPVTHMTRENTFASIELEINIRNNNSIVPSYSEALLMDTANQVVSYQDNNNSSSSVRHGYTPIPGSVQYTSKYYSPNGELSYHSERDQTSPETPPARSTARNVILRLPQTMGGRLRGKRRQWRRHSYAEVLQLREGLARQCPRSSSMLVPSELTADTLQLHNLVSSEPDVIQAGYQARDPSHIVVSPDVIGCGHSRDASHVVVSPDVIGRGLNRETILEVDSDTGSPLPTRSSPTHTSPPESSGSTTPLLGHRSTATNTRPHHSSSVQHNHHPSHCVHPIRPEANNTPAKQQLLASHPHSLRHVICNHRLHGPRDPNSPYTDPTTNDPPDHNNHQYSLPMDTLSTNDTHPESSLTTHSQTSSRDKLARPEAIPPSPSHPTAPSTGQSESPPCYEAALGMNDPYSPRTESYAHYPRVCRPLCHCPHHNTDHTEPSATSSGWVEARQLGHKDRNAFKIMETAL